MESVDSKSDGYREESRVFQQRGEEKLPVVPSSLFFYPQEPDGVNEAGDVVKLYPEYTVGQFFRFILFQECLDSLVILLWGINCLHDMPVAVNECFVIHLGDEVEGTVRIIPGNTL